jgi:hypothetical protein
VCCSVKISLYWNKGAKPEPWKTVPDHYSPSLHLALCIGVSSVLLASARHFNFSITALTVDLGSSSRADIWLTDLLDRWHPVTVPCWKSLSSSVRPFYWQCWCMEIEWLCAQFYTLVSNGCGWNSRMHSFAGVSTYFCVCSVHTDGKGEIIEIDKGI